jgi:hypothetical protein
MLNPKNPNKQDQIKGALAMLYSVFIWNYQISKKRRKLKLVEDNAANRFCLPILKKRWGNHYLLFIEGLKRKKAESDRPINGPLFTSSSVE